MQYNILRSNLYLKNIEKKNELKPIKTIYRTFINEIH